MTYIFDFLINLAMLHSRMLVVVSVPTTNTSKRRPNILVSFKPIYCSKTMSKST